MVFTSIILPLLILNAVFWGNVVSSEWVKSFKVDNHQDPT